MISSRSLCDFGAAAKFFCALLLCLLAIMPVIGLASLDEAYGMVTNVVDGDTFDVTMEKASEKVAYQVERVRLADVDSPEMDSENGPVARDFTYAVLLNKRVFLDIDDLSETGRDSYGRLICVAYLSGFYGQPIAAPNFNRLLVDSGFASLDNFTNNEFDPGNWWSQSAPQIVPQIDAQPKSDPLQKLGSDLQKNFTEDLLPKLSQSAGQELDRAAAESWKWIKKQINASINSS
jgi:endonuclease YncB( thermonuclease family)